MSRFLRSPWRVSLLVALVGSPPREEPAGRDPGWRAWRGVACMSHLARRAPRLGPSARLGMGPQALYFDAADTGTPADHAGLPAPAGLGPSCCHRQRAAGRGRPERLRSASKSDAAGAPRRRI